MAFLRSASTTDHGTVVYGDGVVLRTPQMSDYAAWAELRAKSRDFLTPWEPRWSSSELTRASFRRRIRHYHRDVREDIAYPFFVFSTPENQLMGGLTLSNVRRGVSQACTLGYWVGLPYARRGRMSASLRAVVPFVFETLGLHRIEASCLSANAASIRLLEKLGFRREGLARRYLMINGHWQDHLLYALLEDDPRP